MYYLHLILSPVLIAHQTYVHDHARGPKTWLINSDILYVGMLQDSTKDSRGIPYLDESLII